jgi:hypothetical protein
MTEGAFDLLERELCVLARELSACGIPVIIGGGMGLLLRDKVVRKVAANTLRSYPALRATSDLDVFLNTETIVDSERTEVLRRTLDDLGYVPLDGAYYYQFVKPLPQGSALPEVKLDLLAAFPEKGEFKSDMRRIRPLGFKGLHAHIAPEAVTVEEYLLPVKLGHDGSEVEVLVPHPFSYIVLKLFAFRDRRDDPEKLYGRYHSFDIYTALAMMTEAEFEQGLELRGRYADTDQMREAGEIAREYFSSLTDLGMIRMREHLREVGTSEDEVRLEDFIRDLGDLFA